MNTSEIKAMRESIGEIEHKYRVYITGVGMRAVHSFDNETGTKRTAWLHYWDHLNERTAKIKGYVSKTRLKDCVLMQKTPWKDRNGKAIFVGDIIEDGICLTIVRYSSNGMLNLYPPIGNTISGVVVGNIFENENLLK